MQHYSCIWFQQDIEEETPEELISMLKQGTKVYFFTYDPIDSLYQYELLEKASEEKFLFLYETQFNQTLNNDFTYFDGNVPNEILDALVRFTKSSKPFNKEQYVIEHADFDGNIIVSAGAGTGKTTVLINRIIYLRLMLPQMNFAQIALITFTNNAAAHLREQLVQSIKMYFQLTNDLDYITLLDEIKQMEIGTIHSFSYSILRQNQEDLFNKTDITISRFNYERRKIIENVINDYHEKFPETFQYFKYIEQHIIVHAVEAIINQINNYSIPQESIINMDFGESDDNSHHLYNYVVKETIQRLNTFKNEHEYFEVHDLISKMDTIIKDEQQYIIPYDYVVIDEFQDTDQQQTKLFSYLANHYPLNLFVVGDIKQSIYRFRGADYTAFDQLKAQTIIDAHYFLQLNYRSQRNLLNNFNHLFSQWPEIVTSFVYDERDKLLPGFGDDSLNQGDVRRVEHETNIQQVNFLKELEFKDTAVLLRSNREVNELSALCERHNIFYTSEQDGDFYRSLPVREFYQLLLRFIHPSLKKNKYALHISSYGARSIETADILNDFSPERTAIDRVLTQQHDPFEKYTEAFKHRGIFEVFNDIIQDINPAKNYAQRFIKNRLLNSNIDRATLHRQSYILEQEYRLNLDHLLYQLKKELENTVPTLNNLEKVLSIKMKTDKTVSRIKYDLSDDGRLKLMTVHKAKGLEFDNVFLPHTKKLFRNFNKTNVLVHDNKLGYRTHIKKGITYVNNHYLGMKDREYIENVGEEARLLYVALTRAKQNVYVDAPSQSNNFTCRSWGDLIAKGFTAEAKSQSMV